MTPRLSIIAASIRRIGQAPTETVESSDQYWDNVVLAMRMDAVGDSDPYWSNTVLAMHMDGTGGSTTFTDEKGKAITAVGNCSISTAESKFGGSSAYFDGTGDALTIPNSQAAPVLAFGSGDFTIEGWILPLTMPYSSGYLLGFGRAAALSTGIHVSLLNTGGLGIGLNTEGYTFITSGHSSLIGNGWRHFAVVRSSNTITAYIDGVSRGGTSFTGTLGATGDPYYIGSDSWYASNCYKGHLDDLRITKGVARYTANFTPPTSAFQTSSSPFIDEKAHTVIANGNVAIQTTTKKFGTGSAYFDGIDDYLVISSSPDFAMGTGDFTVEFWFNLLNPGASNIDLVNATNSSFRVGIITQTIRYMVNGGVTVITYPFTFVANTWYHIAITRRSGTARMYLNGVNVGTATDTSNLGQYPLYIGALSAGGSIYYHANAYIDDLRITKGVARYTADFTPPAQALPVTLPYDKWWDNVVLLMKMDTPVSVDQYGANVSLAMRMDGVNNSTSFNDLTGKTVTASGSSKTSTTQSKFGGSSAYSDGANSYLAVTHSADLSMDSSDFTMEMWVYKVANGPLLSKSGKYNESYYNYALVVGTSGNIILSIGSSSSTPYGTSHGSVIGVSAIPSAQWTHVAAVKSGTQYRLYINGNLDAQATLAGVPSDQRAGVLRIFQEEGASTGYSGYIDDLRITKGVARYSTNFTPSAQALPDLSYSVFTDEKGHSITKGGGITVQSTIKKYGTGAAYFDGVDDYLSVPSSADFGFGTGDFTIEAWVYILADSPQNSGNSLRSAYICASYTHINLAGTFGFYVLGDASTTGIGLGLSVYDGAYKSCVATVTVTKGAWHHVAVTRASGAVMLFLDGIKQTVTDTILTANLVTQTTNPIWIGATNHSDYPSKLNGYIDDLRITKGVARYISNFTPPGLPLPSGDANSLAYDPYRANTVLLMHMDTDFTDVTGKVTTLSGCTISNAVHKFGGGSGYFNGSTSLSLPYSTDFDFGSGDFTLEAWIYLQNLTGNKTIIQRYQTGNRCWDFLLTGDVTNFRCSTNGTADSVSVNGPIITANTWTHVAVVRYGSVLRMFTNGVAGTDASFTGSIYATNGGPSVGKNQDDAWYFNGYIDDLRITKGIARYVGNFTPPAVTFKDN